MFPQFVVNGDGCSSLLWSPVSRGCQCTTKLILLNGVRRRKLKFEVLILWMKKNCVAAVMMDEVIAGMTVITMRWQWWSQYGDYGDHTGKEYWHKQGGRLWPGRGHGDRFLHPKVPGYRWTRSRIIHEDRSNQWAWSRVYRIRWF